MRPDSHMQLANNCPCFLFCLFFSSLEMSLFLSIMYHYGFLFVRIVRCTFSFRVVLFYLDHSLDFWRQLIICDKPINQPIGMTSKKHPVLIARSPHRTPIAFIIYLLLYLVTNTDWFELHLTGKQYVHV